MTTPPLPRIEIEIREAVFDILGGEELIATSWERVYDPDDKAYVLNKIDHAICNIITQRLKLALAPDSSIQVRNIKA